MTRVIVTVAVLAVASAPAVLAQSPDQPARAFVSVSGGYQSANRTVTNSGTFPLYDETGSFTGSRSIGKGMFFDVGGGMHVFGKVSAGVSFARHFKPANVPFEVKAPHPLFFNQPRTTTLNVNDMRHSENVVHLQLLYQLFSSSRYDASVFGGPSIYSIKEDSVQDVSATETGSPYTALTMNATFTSASKSAVGFNIGMAVNYHLTGPLGAGLVVRYTGASADLPWGKVKAGGPQVGLNVRYTF